MDDKLKDITKKLEQGISSLFDSAKYKAYLNTMAKFHNYSFNNSLLIHMQRPDATHVAGYKAWLRFKRHVMTGEKGIRIIAPAPYRQVFLEKQRDQFGNVVIGADGKPIVEEVERIVPSYKVSIVFDVSQTTGEPLPEIVKQLSGCVENYEILKEALQDASPVPIRYAEISSAANGYYSHVDKEIVVKSDLSEMQTIKTCIHEIAHSVLHDKDTGTQKEESLTNRDREVQAESVAYAVCQHLGLDTSDYSFGYIAGWSSGRDMKELKAAMNVIRETADKMISDISDRYETLKTEKSPVRGIDAPIVDEGYEKQFSRRIAM